MLERLQTLEENVKFLMEFRSKYSLDRIRGDKSLEWALRYGLLESTQIVIDVACHLVSKYHLGIPSTYAECVELLEKHRYIDADLARKLLGMVGLRNLLIHEYAHVDLMKLYGLLDHLEDFRGFAMAVKGLV